MLLPLARLPVDLGFDPVAGTIALSVRVTGPGCPLQANPVFFRWLELLTQQPLKDAQNEAPDDPWHRLEWLVELAESSLEIQGLPHAVVPFQNFPSVEHLPFAPAVLSVGALGRFPSAAPLWQTELREILPRHEVPVGPARWFIGQDLPSTRSLVPSTVPVPVPSCEQLARGPENPLLAKVVEQTREPELSLVYSPANAASIETAATLVADGLARDQRVLVLISPANADAFRGALAARGLEFCGGYAAESSLGGSALRREMLTRYAEPPQLPPDSGTPEFLDVSAQEARRKKTATRHHLAARATRSQTR